VTGAASGMELTAVQVFANAGAQAVMADAGEVAVKQDAHKSAAAGRKSMGILCDVSDEAMVEQIVPMHGLRVRPVVSYI
jgi:NAD(P)-dependent dehydrogenase (short-subunit alcohol dehydrogenase family)